jgi:hypothetical protein
MVRVCRRNLTSALAVVLWLLLVSVSHATDLVWPERSKNLGWPRPPQAGKILEDRFANASKDALGSASDIAAIKSAVLSVRPSSEIDEIRWLSSTLVMAQVSNRGATAWYYVVEKTTDEWRVRIFYLLWIS